MNHRNHALPNEVIALSATLIRGRILLNQYYRKPWFSAYLSS